MRVVCGCRDSLAVVVRRAVRRRDGERDWTIVCRRHAARGAACVLDIIHDERAIAAGVRGAGVGCWRDACIASTALIVHRRN